MIRWSFLFILNECREFLDITQLNINLISESFKFD